MNNEQIILELERLLECIGPGANATPAVRAVLARLRDEELAAALVRLRKVSP